MLSSSFAEYCADAGDCTAGDASCCAICLGRGRALCGDLAGSPGFLAHCGRFGSTGRDIRFANRGHYLWAFAVGSLSFGRAGGFLLGMFRDCIRFA